MMMTMAMNKRPISEARDPDLRGSEPALHRAAGRVSEVEPPGESSE